MTRSPELLQPAETIKDRLKSSNPITRLDMVGTIGMMCKKITSPPERFIDDFGHVSLLTTKPAEIKELIDPVIELLEDPEPLVQAEAIWTLGEIGGEKVQEIFKTTLASDSPTLRANTVEALGKIGGREANELVKKALQDPDENVRITAVETLGSTLEKTKRPLEQVVDAFGHVCVITPTAQEKQDILNSLLEIVKTDSSGHVRLKAAMKIAESFDSAAIAQLHEIIKQGKPLTIELNGKPLGEEFLHADAQPEEFSRLSKLLGGVVSPEELQEMIDIGVIVQLGEGKIAKVHSVVVEIVRATNKRFLESIDLKPTHKKLLCAFTSNVDEVCFLKDNLSAQQKIDKAIEDALAEGSTLGKQPQDVTKEIEKIISETDKDKLPSKINTKAQVIGFILRMFQNSGGKRSIADLENKPDSGKRLADWIRDIFHPELSKVGGASAQMADFLTGIGESNVTVYTEYNSSAQAQAYQQPTNFLRIVDGGFRVYKVYKPESIRNTDPTKVNYPVERFPSISVTFNGREIKAGTSSDREIFTTEYYDKNDKTIDFFPLFEFTPKVLSTIGSEFEYFIINGPHYIQRYPEDKYNTIAPCMAEQLRSLHSAGMKIHYEFSGSTGREVGKGEWTGIKYFSDVLKGNITSMGINNKELREVVASIKTELDSSIEVVNNDNPYSIYNNAITLASYLEVDRLYIHGHSTDITVRRNTTREGLETEVRADMHAKQRVVEWLLGEKSEYPTPKERQPSRLLKREGFTDLMKFAETLADSSNVQGIDKVKLMRQVAVNGYEPPKEDNYSAVIVPVKWIYGDTKVTTSSGDITSSTALIQSGL